jgi:DNA-binding NarL/FixJ family response regulator
MPIRVLIVEENAVARSFLTRVVRESFSDDIEFSEASDPDSARTALGIGPDETPPVNPDAFRLVLCDLEQADHGGLELLAQLASYPAIKIATTLHSDDDHLFPALQCGAHGYLLKEDRFEVIVEELQRIVRGQPPLSPSMARRFLAYFRRLDAHRPASSGSDTVLSPTGDTTDALNAKEHEVLTYLAKGYTIKEIARLMGIKWQAVNDHIRGAYRKLAAASSPQETIQAGRQALT